MKRLEGLADGWRVRLSAECCTGLQVVAASRGGCTGLLKVTRVINRRVTEHHRIARQGRSYLSLKCGALVILDTYATRIVRPQPVHWPYRGIRGRPP